MTFLYCRSQNQNDVEGTVPGQTFVGGLGAGDVHPHQPLHRGHCEQPPGESDPFG